MDPLFAINGLARTMTPAPPPPPPPTAPAPAVPPPPPPLPPFTKRVPGIDAAMVAPISEKGMAR
jgi:hypothetical protein